MEIDGIRKRKNNNNINVRELNRRIRTTKENRDKEIEGIIKKEKQ